MRVEVFEEFFLVFSDFGEKCIQWADLQRIALKIKVVLHTPFLLSYGNILHLMVF